MVFNGSSETVAGYRGSVIHVANYGGPYSGNFITSIRALRRAVDDVGLRFVLVLSDVARDRPWLSKVQADMRVHVLSGKALCQTAVVRQLLAIAECEDAVLLHTHFTSYDVAAWLAAVRLRSTKRTVGVVWHAHSDFAIRHALGRHIKDLVKHRLMARATNVHVVAVSEGIRDALILRGLSPLKVDVIHNGIDTARVCVSNALRDKVRFELGIPEDARVVLAFGWEPWTKGIDICIKACHALVQDGMRIRLVLVGEARMEEFVRGMTQDSSYPYLLLCRPRECVAEFYSIADVFFAGSRSEGFPYSVGEAMSCALPVVASNIAGTAWARPSPGVVSCDPGDILQAATALREVLSWSDEERSVRGNANSALIAERYSLDVWTKQLRAFYARILGIQSGVGTI